MKRILLCLLFVISAFSSVALEGTTLTLTEARQVFRDGNTTYQQQKFTEARTSYLQLAQAGIHSPELYYNLGTAAARLNLRGEAVQYLSKALELNPHDPDVLANLRRIAPASVVSSLSATHPVKWTASRLALSQWIPLFLVVYLAFGLAGAAYLAGARRSTLLRWVTTGLFLVCLLIGGLTFYRYWQTYNVQYAVVGEPNASVRSGPADKFAQVDTLPEGEIVREISRTEEDWAEVQLTDGRKGYIPTSSLLLI